MAESIVTLRVEARNAIASLNKTTQATKNLSNSAKGATGSLTTASAAAKGLGASLAASLGPLITVGAAVATVSNAIKTFSDRERDITILAQGLKNLGEGTATLNELQKAADKLGNQTLFNQEEFTRGFNLLTSFRKIGVDSYSRVAQAAADIAQVNQVDVTTSFMQLAKALQDPERNLSNLNRSGIAFTKTQTDVIKELMKTNKTAEAHSMILEIVEESYNKLSQAAAEGFAGEVDSLGEAFRDFSETLGKALEPALVAATKALTALIKAANDLFNSPLGQTAAIFTAIALAAKGIPILLAAVTAGLIKIAAAGGVATIALNALPFVAVAGLVGGFTTAIIKATKKQRDYNKALKEGDKQVLKSEFNRLFIQRQKLLARLAKAQATSNKRAEASLKKQLYANEDILDNIKDQLSEKREAIRKNQTLNKKLDESEELTDEIKNNIKAFTKGIADAAIEEKNKIDAFDKYIKKQKDSEKLLQAKIAGNFSEVALQMEINKQVAKHGEHNRKQITDILTANAALKQQGDEIGNNGGEANNLKNIFSDIGIEIKQGIVENLREAIKGSQSFGDALSNVLDRIGDKILDSGLNTLVDGVSNAVQGKSNKDQKFGGALGSVAGSFLGPVGTIAGGFLGNLLPFADGGRPPVGKASVVGERGPELFVPKIGGTIIPNNEIGGGDNTTNIVNVSVDASGSSVSGNSADAQQLGAVIGAAIQAQLIREKRSGGLLAR